MSLYRPLVLYWCQRKGLQAADAEDVAQEVFGAVAKAIDQFHRNQARDSLRGWLRTITNNAIVDHIRRASRQAAGVGGSDAHRGMEDIPSPSPDSDAVVGRDENMILIRQAFELVLGGYKDHTREAFWRVVVEKQKPENVAQALGVGVHVVYLAKSRVLNRLQEEFDGLVDLERDLDSSQTPARTS